jgi:hypothetical protein
MKKKTEQFGYVFTRGIFHARNPCKKLHKSNATCFLSRIKVIFPFGVCLFYGISTVCEIV